ncbi:hypothetical protein ACLK17_06275 [Escherichia coli]
MFESMTTAIPRWSGLYTLSVQRPVTTTLLGAVSGAGQMPWQAGRSVTHYLKITPALHAPRITPW